MERIEFIKGEPYCRFDGTIMTPEACEVLYGYNGEFDILTDNTYIINNTVYTDMKLCDLIKLLGEVHGEIEEYDNILDNGRGWFAHCEEEKLNNTVVIPLRIIESLETIKPFNDFIKDYPNINITKYIEFMDCLNEYYATLYKTH